MVYTDSSGEPTTHYHHKLNLYVDFKLVYNKFSLGSCFLSETHRIRLDIHLMDAHLN